MHFNKYIWGTAAFRFGNWRSREKDKLGAWAKALGNLCAIAFIHRGGFWVGGEPRDGERGAMAAAAATAPAASEEETAARA